MIANILFFPSLHPVSYYDHFYALEAKTFRSLSEIKSLQKLIVLQYTPV